MLSLRFKSDSSRHTAMAVQPTMGARPVPQWQVEQHA